MNQDTDRGEELTLLRRIDSNLSRVAEDLPDVRRRVTSLEGQITLLHGDFGGQSLRMDRIEERLTSIERQLGPQGP